MTFFNNILIFTYFKYIGEFCRYLLGTPPHPEERNHKVRMIYGNGMRPDIWGRFRERFGIKDICEFYAATEGKTSCKKIKNYADTFF